MRKAREIGAQQGLVPGRGKGLVHCGQGAARVCSVAIFALMSRSIRFLSSAMTASSAAVKACGDGGAGEAPARRSTPWTMSVSCLIARKRPMPIC